jgi:TRAP-type mannitol/chloroaromatic compound transport system permease small subunit
LSEGLLPDELEKVAPPGPTDLLTRITDVMAAVGTVWTFLLMLLIVADVVGRSFLSSPIVGVAEVAGQSVVAIVFLQLAAAIRQKRMTRADFLIDPMVRNRPRIGRLLESVFSLLGAAVLFILAYAMWPELHDSLRGTQFFGVPGVFTIPTWPFRLIIFLGAVLSAIAYLALAIEDFVLARRAPGAAS